MKNVIGGILIGVGMTLAFTALPWVAPWYSQSIYDCGVRIGSGASGGTISGFTITGHKTGFCISGGAHDITFNEFSVINAETGLDVR